jgi:hypothetical protein
VIEARLYRAAFVPALLALVLAMFSLESRPRPLPQGLAADVLFDGDQAAASADRLAAQQPDRRAGTPGDRASASIVATAFAARGFRVERDAFTEGGRSLENVVGRRAGGSRREVVVVAARDSSSVPEAGGSASDTAALLELARVFQGRPSSKTLVLASVDGSTLGDVGAERLAGQLGDPALVESVLVVSDLGARERRGSFIVPWSSATGRAGIGLQRTVADSIRQELDRPIDSTGAAGQLFRLAFPLGIGGQGVFLERGFESVRISGSGELPPPGDGGASADRDTLGGLGRATLRTLTALDANGRPAHGPGVYVTAVSQVVPGWVFVLLSGTLLLPVLVTSVDAFARARRRHIDVAVWMRWLGVFVAPFLAALAAAELLALVNATPDPPSAPVAPAENPLDIAALGVLGGVAIVGVLAFLFARSLLRREQARAAAGPTPLEAGATSQTAEGSAAYEQGEDAGDDAGFPASIDPTDADAPADPGPAPPPVIDPADPGAACALALVTAAAALVLWLLNPYAALMAVPAAHLWMLLTLADPAPGGRARAVMLALGLLLPLGVILYYLVALHMDPLTGVWYLLLLVTGHAVNLVTALLGCVWLGALCATVAVARARRAPPPHPLDEDRPSVFGPGAYAGPGALGGPGSAMRR